MEIEDLDDPTKMCTFPYFTDQVCDAPTEKEKFLFGALIEKTFNQQQIRVEMLLNYLEYTSTSISEIKYDKITFPRIQKLCDIINSLQNHCKDLLDESCPSIPWDKLKTNG